MVVQREILCHGHSRTKALRFVFFSLRSACHAVGVVSNTHACSPRLLTHHPLPAGRYSLTRAEKRLAEAKLHGDDLGTSGSLSSVMRHLPRTQGFRDGIHLEHEARSRTKERRETEEDPAVSFECIVNTTLFLHDDSRRQTRRLISDHDSERSEMARRCEK